MVSPFAATCRAPALVLQHEAMFERARTDAMSDEEKKAFNAKKQQGMYVESHPQS